VLIDPRLAEEGTTVADLREQFEHNRRMRALVNDANRIVARVQAAQNRLRGASGAAADTLAKVQVLAGTLLSEPVRYGKPGLQAHINYLSSMTGNTDQKIGRDAIARYQTLARELAALTAELDRVLGPEPGVGTGRAPE
jgi:DNA anti-recombination protein RmuC